jgi:hypothetical protein
MAKKAISKGGTVKPVGVIPMKLWTRIRRHLGSTLAFLIGCLAIIGGLSVLAERGGAGTLIAGFVMVLGSMAYRSAKKRWLGEAKATMTRQVLELIAVALICAAILSQNNLMHVIATDPVPNVVIPVWAIMAYIVIALMPREKKA